MTICCDAFSVPSSSSLDAGRRARVIGALEEALAARRV
jgi:hypothetical protein